MYQFYLIIVSNLYKINYILRTFIIAVFVLCFFSINNNAFSYQKRPIIDKLWQDISKKDQEILRQISIFLESARYDDALRKADELHRNNEVEGEDSNPFFIEKTGFEEALRNLILWRKYSDYTIINSSQNNRKSDIAFSDISRFVEDNRFYPNIAELRRKAENIASINKIPYRLSEQYFRLNPARSLESKLYLIETKSEFLLQFKGTAEEKNKIANEIQSAIVSIWVDEDFNDKQEREFLEKYSNYLTQNDHENRINRLLWDSQFDEARRIFKFVDEDNKKLFTAIIEIKNLPKYIDNIILSVPRKLRNDENLIYSRILWHKSRGDSDEVIDLMLDVENTKYSQKWWSIRRLYARDLLKTKKYKDSYKIISNHNLNVNSKDYWEAEWMAGWIALRFLNHPKVAYNHFDNLHKNVTQPVTISRGAYWLGMASYAMGDKNKAIDWYRTAAKYPLYFYGQLAINKHRTLDPLNASQDIVLPKDPDITVGDARKIAASNASKVAYLLALMGDKMNATKVFEYEVNNADSEGQIAVVMRIVNELNDREMDAKISRAASRKNVFFIQDKFQIVKEVGDGEYAPLVHAIIKQESGFTTSAVSVVGAIGFMQIMPETAKLVAKDLGVPYSKKKLATDISYNVQLGSHYIKQMVDKFDGSQMLAIASYNAGPNATSRWIKEFYDPRDEKDMDRVVDWIELITYAETRNYVQRIMENLIVYKYLMSRSNHEEAK